MNRFGTTLVYILLGLNTVGVGYLIINKPSGTSTIQTKIGPAELAQLDKIWAQAQEFRTELENVASRATFPNEKAKIQANEYLQNHRMVFELARLRHENVRVEKSRETAINFLNVVWGTDSFFGGIKVISVPKWQFSKYNQITSDYDAYPNVSFAKMEAIDNEFKVMAISLMKDMK